MKKINKFRVVQILSLAVMLGCGGYIIYVNGQYKSAKEDYEQIQSFVTVEEPADEVTTPGTVSVENGTVSVKTAQGEEKEETFVPVPLKEYDEPMLHVDHYGLGKVNDNYRGWLSACNNGISYPIAIGKDNGEYLHKTFTKKNNFAGCIFLDYRCSSDYKDFNTFIYGHSMKDGTMFRRLINYEDDLYCLKYPCFYIYTKEGRTRYNIFSVYKTDSDEVLSIVGDTTDETKRAFISEAKKRSLHNFRDVTVGIDDNIVSLVTCDVHTDSKRFVVCGVKVDY
ncbi:MAG: class B sortase [Firmicutes bacterium]|nr:class B sortase [Bacillota bacterium]